MSLKDVFIFQRTLFHKDRLTFSRQILLVNNTIPIQYNNQWLL